MCWKSETRLRDLPDNEPIRLRRGRKVVLAATPRSLMNEARISGTMCLDQLERAFNAELTR